MKRTPKPVSVRAGQTEFLKVNTEPWEWRDLYHWILALNWPRFAALILGGYTAINLVFAALYSIGGDCIAGMTRGSFLDAFFFSVQTLATVGYGHMYPQTLYGHVIAIIEIIAGMFWLAVITGLIFVRFSRPPRAFCSANRWLSRRSTASRPLCCGLPTCVSTAWSRLSFASCLCGTSLPWKTKVTAIFMR
jgi:hypothetical protein